jgi:signal peptidase
VIVGVANVLWTVVALVAVVIASFALVLAIASHVFTSTELYTVFGHPVMTVVSGSMAPVIRTGDLVYDDRLTATHADHLHVGDIISFRSSPGAQQIVTHRIHAVTTIDGTTAYQTKGDANPGPDAALVHPDQLVGLYRGSVPYGGYALHALHQPFALVLLFAAPVLWLLSGWLFSLARRADGSEGDG